MQLGPTDSGRADRFRTGRLSNFFPVRRRHHRTALGAEPTLVDHAANLTSRRLNWFGRTGPEVTSSVVSSCPGSALEQRRLLLGLRQP